MVGQDLAFDVFGDGAGEDDFFEVAAFGDERFRRIAVRDAHDVLFNDGAGIKLRRDVVARGADDLHAACEGLMVRFCADKCRQEGVVDVDDVVRKFRDHVVADDLHVARKDDEGDAFAAKKIHFGFLDFGLVRMILVDRPDVVGNVELIRDVAQILVVTDDAGNFDVPFSGAVACEKVVEAVAHFAHKDGHARRFVAEIEIVRHLIALGIERPDDIMQFFAGNEEVFQLPFDAHEKHIVEMIDILVEIHDVALVVRDKTRDLRNDARRIGAM